MTKRESDLEQEKMANELEGLRQSAEHRAKFDAGVDLAKYLTFVLDEEEYGISILRVREIFGYTQVTPVPKTPGYVRGVINLRGQVIPIIDLRVKFGMRTGEISSETCIIVVEAKLESDEGQDVLMGFIVDRVQEVLDIPESNIDAAPSFGADIDTKYIQGMGKVDEEVKILLDIDEVLGEEELVALEGVGKDEQHPQESATG